MKTHKFKKEKNVHKPKGVTQSITDPSLKTLSKKKKIKEEKIKCYM